MTLQHVPPNLGRKGNRRYEFAINCVLRTAVKDEMDDSPHISRWLGKLSKGSFKTNYNRFLHFMLFLRRGDSRFKDSTIAELVVFQKNARGDEEFELLDQLQKHAQNLSVRTTNLVKYPTGYRDARVSSKECAYWVVHSFFVHNRAAFPKDKFILSSEMEPTESLLTLEILREAILRSRPDYAAIWLCMFMAGMGIHELLYWSNNGWKKLKKDLDDGSTTPIIYIPGRKKGKNRIARAFRTRIGGDALTYLMRYLEGRRKKARYNFDRSFKEGALHKGMRFNPNIIFYTNRGTPMTKECLKKYWSRVLKGLGYLHPFDNGMYAGNRYGYHGHLMRSLFRTQWSKSPVKDFLGEAYMGHVTDKNGYNRAQTDHKWSSAQYRRVLPWLNIMSGNKPFDLYNEEEIEEQVIKESEKKATALFVQEKALMREKFDDLIDTKLRDWDESADLREARASLLESIEPIE